MKKQLLKVLFAKFESAAEEKIKSIQFVLNYMTGKLKTIVETKTGERYSTTEDLKESEFSKLMEQDAKANFQFDKIDLITIIISNTFFIETVVAYNYLGQKLREEKNEQL